jgi:RHS repeat-associated protein
MRWDKHGIGSQATAALCIGLILSSAIPAQAQAAPRPRARAQGGAGPNRAAALARLASRTAPNQAKMAEAGRKAAAIREAHLPSLLGGLAQASEAARSTRERLGAAKGERARANAEAQLRGLGRAIESLSERVRKEPKAASSAGKVNSANRLGKAIAAAVQRGKRAGGLGAVDAALPPARKGAALQKERPRLAPPLSPPEPRQNIKLGEAAPEETRALYAAMLDAPGLEVETEAGLVDPALLAAGFIPEPRLASLSMGDLGGLIDLAGGALAPPEAADLAETNDVRITPAMRAEVERLQRSPLALYNLVHDGFVPEPYYGVKKGSAGAWEERAGNDFDLSTLLIALLRAAQIPARYEYGTVEITPEQAMAWTGTTRADWAADVLRSTGIPAVRVLQGSKLVAVRVEHVWVRAYVPYSNYRGHPREASRSIWVRLDPTLKRAKVKPAVNLRGAVAFDFPGFFSTIGPQTPLERFEKQLRDHVKASGIDCKTLDDAIPARVLVPDALTVLPAELPARIGASLATFAGVPSSMRHTASVGVGDWSVSLELPAVYGSALTLRYRGLTQSDQAAIDQAGGVAALSSPSTVKVVPALFVDGQERGRGAAVLPGLDQELNVSMSIPHGGVSTVRHHIVSGAVFAVGFPVGTVPESVVAAREAELEAAVKAGKRGDDLEAVRGNRALWRYFSQVDREVPRIFGLEWMRLARDVSEGIAGRGVRSSLLFGAPVEVAPGEFLIDVPRYSMRPYAVDGDNSRSDEAAELSGYHSSAREHLIWEETVHTPAISTARIFQVASQQALTIHDIGPANVSLVASLPYSQVAKDDIRDAVHAGLRAKVPERPITWGAYHNAEGYVLRDPVTGAADFRIHGLFSGGAANGEGDLSDVNGCPACDSSSAPAGSTVDIATGSLLFSETDLTLPARGIPVVLARRYDSKSPHGGRLGPGWQHSYEMRLVFEADGSANFVNDSFRVQRYQRNADGTFQRPAGYHETLTAVAGGHVLRFQDGLEYRLRADGQLGAIADLNGHVVELTYDAQSRLSTVKDPSGQVALTFAYDGAGQLDSVTDAASRVVRYGHENGNLTSVTDVLGKAQTFAYDPAHRLISKTDKNGNTVSELYDGRGRWIGSVEPDGQGRSVAYDFLNRRAVHTDKRGAQTIWEYNERGNPLAITDPLGNRRVMEWDSDHNKLAETDARGGRTVMTYNGNGNMLTRVDPLTARTEFTYNALGKVLTVKDAHDKLSINTYDARGNLETSQDAENAVTTYVYTADGLPERITQPGSAVTQLVYDARGNVSQMIDPENGTTILGYDAEGQLQSIKDPNQKTRTMVTDAAGRVLSMKDALLAETKFEYDDQGNRTATVDPENKRTIFGYDALNRLVSVTDPLGGVTRTEYDSEGNLTARVDAMGRRTTYKYDLAGRLVESVDALGNATTVGYCADVVSQPCATVDPLGNLTETFFDSVGRPTSTVDANGSKVEQGYDLLGRRATLKDPLERPTTFTYDNVGRVLTVKDALNGLTTYGYDGRGNRTSVKDANNFTTTFVYDKANRLLSEKNPIDKTTSYEYDAAGNRRFKNDPNGVRTEYQYDDNRRLKKVLFPDGSSYEYAYDSRGNRTLERSSSHERELIYDELSRVREVRDNTLSKVLTLAYDANGNRTRMALNSGEVTTYRWDALGRLAELTDPDSQATRFNYDAAGRRTRVAFANNTSAAYAYDPAGQVTSIAYAGGSGQVLNSFGYAYDKAGNRLEKRFHNGSKEVYGYDALNRLTSARYITAATAGIPGERMVSYGYDAVGNRLEMSDSSKPSQTKWATSITGSTQNLFIPAPFTGAVGAPDVTGCAPYSNKMWAPSTGGAGQEFIQASFGTPQFATGVTVHEIQLAPFVVRIDLIEQNGTAHTVYSGGDTTVCGGFLNVTFPRTSYKVASVKVFTQVAGTEAIDAVGLVVPTIDSYQYNAFNQLTSLDSGGALTSYTYDNNGNLTREQTGSAITQYVYNQDNRLTGVVLPGGGGQSYGYDANGLRISRNDGAVTTHFLLDGLRVLGEYSGGSRRAWYNQSLARIDEVLSIVNSSGKHFVQSDALGSTYGLTNQAGTLVTGYGYDVFGARTRTFGSVEQPVGFASGWQDVPPGAVHLGDRDLFTKLGRWPQPDRAGFVDGPNLYQYALSNPATWKDPSGLVTAIGLARQVGQIAAEAWIDSGLGYISAAVQFGDPEDNTILFYGAGLVLGGIVLGILAGSCSDRMAKTDWGDLSGILREARMGKGMFGVGKATKSQADTLGKAWVGPGFRTASDGRTLVSKDGLKIYRPPTFKKSLNKWQANLETKLTETGRPIGNAHIDIEDAF